MIRKNRLIRRAPAAREMDSVAERQSKLRSRENDSALLERCRRLWDNMDGFRQQRARGRRFCYGDQWGDYITVNGKTMTYREYLLSTGNIVIQTNQIKNRVETMVGTMTRAHNEPVCHAADRAEQRYGEIMTAAVQANCNKNRIMELYKQWLREINLGGLAVAYESYDDHSGPGRGPDSWTQYVNPNMFIMDGEMIDPRFWDCSLVGRFFYGSFEEICAQFARTPDDFAVLREIYGEAAGVFRPADVREITDKNDEGDLVFMRSSDPSRCYVCEAWTKERKARIRVNDLNEGTEEVVDFDDAARRAEIREENRRRRDLAVSSGWREEDVPYIIGDGFGRDEGERNGFFIDTFWYCRFLAPDGTVLWEGESPYPGRSHPFTICAFPLVDGKLVGYMTDAIDHNIAMNRAIVMHDWLTRVQAKGVTIVPKALVPKDMSYQEFANSWTEMDGMVFVDLKPGQEGLFPKVFHGSAQTFDVGGLLSTYQSLMNSGSPVNGALQGRDPASGTSGALYAQMANNASTSIAAVMDTFQRFTEEVLVKKMKNIRQFYEPERYASIAGDISGAFEGLDLNDVGDMEYDLTVKEGSSTPVARAAVNQDAKEFLLNGFISFEEYLKIADVPYADKILQERQSEQQAAAQQAAGPSAPAQAGQPQPLPDEG